MDSTPLKWGGQKTNWILYPFFYNLQNPLRHIWHAEGISLSKLTSGAGWVICSVPWNDSPAGNDHTYFSNTVLGWSKHPSYTMYPGRDWVESSLETAASQDTISVGVGRTISQGHLEKLAHLTLVWATSPWRGLPSMFWVLWHQDFLPEAFLDRITVLRSVHSRKALAVSAVSTPSLSEGALEKWHSASEVHSLRSLYSARAAT